MSARSRRRRMSESYGWVLLRSRLGDREAWRCGEMLSVLLLLGEGDRDEEEDMGWWEPRERGSGDEWQSRDEWRDRRDDRRGGDGEGLPASLLVMPAPEDRREGAGLLLYLRWGEGECDESRRRRRPGERDDQGWRGRVDRCRPSDEQLSLDISRRSRRERLAGGDLCRVGEGESGWCRRPSDPCPISIHRWPLTGSTVSTRVTVSSFWTGLMLSPWRLSVVRGTQLPQCVRAHVLVRNSGTHSWLRWSVTYELLPVALHVL